MCPHFYRLKVSLDLGLTLYISRVIRTQRSGFEGEGMEDVVWHFYLDAFHFFGLLSYEVYTFLVFCLGISLWRYKRTECVGIFKGFALEEHCYSLEA